MATQMVCAKTLSVAGPQVEAELRNAKVRKRDILNTRPGASPCKAILHVCGKRDTGVVEKLLCHIIQFCESSGYKSVAIPAICAGTGGLDPGLVAHAILRGVKTTASSHSLQCLTNVRFVLNKINVFLAFKRQAMQMFPSSSLNTVAAHDLQHASVSVMNNNPRILHSSSTVQQSVIFIVDLCRKNVDDAVTKLMSLYQTQCTTETMQEEEHSGFTQDFVQGLKQLMETLGAYLE